MTFVYGLRDGLYVIMFGFLTELYNETHTMERPLDGPTKTQKQLSEAERLASIIIYDTRVNMDSLSAPSAYLNRPLQEVLIQTVGRAAQFAVPRTVPWVEIYKAPGRASSGAKPIRVVNADLLDTAYSIMSSCRGHVAILNAGNAYGAGGGAILGQRALEEDLCRRTNLLLSLYQFRELHDAQNPRAGPYIKDLLYTPGVQVLSDNAYNGHNKSWPVDIITACAVRYDRVQPYTAPDKELMSSKIQMIFSCAKANGVQHLVLCALGCGAFNNDPLQCANLFKYWCQQYASWFQSITFAVLSGPGNKNFETFRHVLQGTLFAPPFRA